MGTPQTNFTVDGVQEEADKNRLAFQDIYQVGGNTPLHLSL